MKNAEIYSTPGLSTDIATVSAAGPPSGPSGSEGQVIGNGEPSKKSDFFLQELAWVFYDAST